MVDGGLHAAELWSLDVQHLQDIVGQCVDQVGDAGQRLGGVVLGLLQRPLLVWRLSETEKRRDWHPRIWGWHHFLHILTQITWRSLWKLIIFTLALIYDVIFTEKQCRSFSPSAWQRTAANLHIWGARSQKTNWLLINGLVFAALICLQVSLTGCKKTLKSPPDTSMSDRKTSQNPSPFTNLN